MTSRMRTAALALFTWILLSPLAAHAFGPPDTAPGLGTRLVHKLILIQFQMRSEMAATLKSFAASPDLFALAPLLGLAVLYGAVHAAGPGHGKAVATAYMLHGNRKTKDGVLFGNIVAFSHGLSGILTVLCIKWFLEIRMTTGLKDATRLTSQVSFSLVILLGLFLLISGIYEAARPKPHQESAPKAGGLLAAVAFGMVPCPGVVTVMLLAMGLHLTYLGILMAFGITLGMALTISAAVILVVAGKNAGLKASTTRGRRLPGILTAVSGMALTALGALMLTGL
ncbi:hypothetical protein [Desulfoluna spongiiphila]|uniref:Nickel/cobalt efflux system n=1 Tax=Desulfoluna spongiiphila TaxID=419481 RepID=A0A1G5HCW9_9BACT|nr:hypothetical protein [Desulfoluna spongiiphila]SCY61705.1 ABC-type nickel/cobalt efflux system, permease component RcnA [Desulfoluna spongiiphila]